MQLFLSIKVIVFLLVILYFPSDSIPVTFAYLSKDFFFPNLISVRHHASRFCSTFYFVSIITCMWKSFSYEPHYEKTAFCICVNKVADQLRGKSEADQRLCFRYTDSTIPLLPKSEISRL